MKLAIVVGHNSARQGARLAVSMRPLPRAASEYELNNALAEKIARLGDRQGLEVRIFRRVAVGDYQAELEAVYSDVDAWGARAAIELHFNSHEDRAANGSEIFSSGSTRSLALAGAIQRATVAAIGLADRGVKTRRNSGRGYVSLIAGRAPAVLWEPFFGSSASDIHRLVNRGGLDALAEAAVAGAVVALDAFPRDDLSASRIRKAAKQIKTLAGAGGGAAIGKATLDGATGETPPPVLPDIPGLGDWQGVLQVLAGQPLWLVLILLCCGAVWWWADRADCARVDDHARGRS